MGTRGYKLIRFRGRYYRYYNHYDSYPDSFGAGLVSEIPRDPEGYQKWLAKQRAKASEWDSALENFLHVKRLNAEGTNDQEPDGQHSDAASEASKGALLHWSYDVGGDVDELPLPSYMPIFNDVLIEWIYVLDLDREIFSIDHGAHLKMGCIPRLRWIYALAKTDNGDRLLLPDLLPENATTSLVVRSDPPDVGLIQRYEELDIEIVTPKGMQVFHPTQRHEPLFCARIFQFFQRAQTQVLAHLLLGWKPNDFPFREIAFTILCLGSGRQNVSLVEELRLANDDAHGCANLRSNTDRDVEPEFVAHMGVGSHLNDNPAGSAPKSSMYWFEGILVHLVARLDNPDTIPESVARVVQRAREDCSQQPVDAVLISIAHIVLVRVLSGHKVQHTKSLPLFFFCDQPSQDPRERFSPSKLKELLQRKERIAAREDTRAERQARQRYYADGTESKDDEIDDPEGDYEEEGAGSISFDLPKAVNLDEIYREITKTEPSFLALAHFLHSSTRASVTTKGCFATEIYRLIIEHIGDVETHGACMAVSSEFRETCLRNSRFNEGWELRPNDATMAYTHAREVWNKEQPPSHRSDRIKRWRNLKKTEPALMPGMRLVELATASERDITIDRVISNQPNADYGSIWRVVVGRFRHRRSVLLDMNLWFRGVERHLLV
ncbi:hypothetical protein IMSHALPRED_002210 [Imshaugia aleurites]|uniref:Uncharacterized protein n=1 Tax=Imshaugia aleurites TaxID=172621 RepID=A0A8H3J584_9LECA|nr:hypothetical protein IMSHALPRED_002210 [Imshaugia aleurites]